MKRVILSMICLSFCTVTWAQLVKIGTEIQINTTSTEAQQNPDIDMNTSGNYVIVWESFEQDGSGYGSYFQLFDNLGVAVGSETILNTTTTEDQRFPNVAMDDGGAFVAVWNTYDQDGDGWGIYQSLFSSAGIATTTETIVNQTTAGQQRFPKVAMNGSGAYVITWENDSDIYARAYDASGTAITNELLVNTTTGTQTHPEVAIATDGSFVVVWQSFDQDGDDYGIYATLFDASGTAQTGEISVNGTSSDNQIDSNVAMDASGNFTVTWVSNAQDGSQEGIYARLFDNTGTALGTEFQVNTTTAGAQDNPSIDMIDNGNFVIAWNSYGQDGDLFGIYHQAFYATGLSNGSETLVNTTTSEFQQFPTVALYDNSTAVIVWQDGNRLSSTTSVDGSNQTIVAQRYDASSLPVNLISLRAKAINNKDICVDWTTASEVNNKGFFVERSANARDWETLDFVDGAGNRIIPKDYVYLDKMPLLGVNYYRLRQVDFDEKHEYSDIVHDQITSEGLVVYPNPTRNILRYQGIELTNIQEIRLFDLTGKPLIHQTSDFNGQIDVRNLASGIYQLQIRVHGDFFVEDILIR